MKVRQHTFRLDHKGRAIDDKDHPRPVKRKTYIVYVMRQLNRILYVGEATRGAHRCWQGFRWNHKQLKYRWKEDKDLNNVTIECLIFGGFKPYGALKKNHVRKAVEADIASEIQSLTGQWPCKLSRIDVYGSIIRTKRLAAFSRAIIKRLQHHGWVYGKRRGGSALTRQEKRSPGVEVSSVAAFERNLPRGRGNGSKIASFDIRKAS